jgi:Zn finger protein HypA/HybF involved in hydrogenase expression
MGRMHIEFADKIIDAINREAATIGVTPEELVRVEIGQRFGYGTAFASSSLQPIPVSPPRFSEDQLESTLMKQVMYASAAMGQLRCTECIQKVEIIDVRNGKCGKCGAAIPS